MTIAADNETRRAQLRRTGYNHYLRTGHVPLEIKSALGEDIAAGGYWVKFNPYHDPDNGRFTFAPGHPNAVSSPVISNRRNSPRSRGVIDRRPTIIPPSALKDRARKVKARHTELIRMPKMEVVLFGPGVSVVPIPVAPLEEFDAAANIASRMYRLDAVITGPQTDFFIGTGGLVGQAVNDKQVYGNSSPGRYYFGEVIGGDGSSRLVFGLGDPPVGKVRAGIGGGIPLLMEGKDVPGFNRSWNRYKTSSGIGKSIVAYNSNTNTTALFVQPDGESGYSLGIVRDYIRKSGYDYALAFDGSGSTSLNYQDRQIISPETLRQPLIPLGIGFKSK